MSPHMVTPTKGGGFSCDSNCPNWKAMGICLHTVAVAEVNKKLQQFLSSKKKKKGVNFTKLLTTSMPKGRGRKGSVAPRTQKPSQPITTRVEMNASSDTPVDCAVPPTVTCHAHEGGSVFMPGFALSTFQHGTITCAAVTLEFLQTLHYTFHVPTTVSPRSSP